MYNFSVLPHVLSHHTVNVVTLSNFNLGLSSEGNYIMIAQPSIISRAFSSALLKSCSSYCLTQPLEYAFQSTFPHLLSLSGELTSPVCHPPASLEFHSTSFLILTHAGQVTLLITGYLTLSLSLSNSDSRYTKVPQEQFHWVTGSSNLLASRPYINQIYLSEMFQ